MLCYISILAISLNGEETLEKLSDPDPDSDLHQNLALLSLAGHLDTKKFRPIAWKLVKNHVTDRQTNAIAQHTVLGTIYFSAK